MIHISSEHATFDRFKDGKFHYLRIYFSDGGLEWSYREDGYEWQRCSHEWAKELEMNYRAHHQNKNMAA